MFCCDLTPHASAVCFAHPLFAQALHVKGIAQQALIGMRSHWHPIGMSFNYGATHQWSQRCAGPPKARRHATSWALTQEAGKLMSSAQAAQGSTRSCNFSMASNASIQDGPSCCSYAACCHGMRGQQTLRQGTDASNHDAGKSAVQAIESSPSNSTSSSSTNSMVMNSCA